MPGSGQPTQIQPSRAFTGALQPYSLWHLIGYFLKLGTFLLVWRVKRLPEPLIVLGAALLGCSFPRSFGKRRRYGTETRAELDAAGL